MEFDIYETEKQYQPKEELFTDDEFEITKLKKIIYGKLDETERRIILAYAEFASMRDTAKLFKVSSTTIWKEIKKIREKIIMYYDF